ncbi:hypothetical protein BCEP4_2310007 [Burkholderia cepacia]|nr:hypothetical protein BCEP4_2310007 [Burkholderia cepacia]
MIALQLTHHNIFTDSKFFNIFSDQPLRCLPASSPCFTRFWIPEFWLDFFSGSSPDPLKFQHLLNIHTALIQQIKHASRYFLRLVFTN